MAYKGVCIKVADYGQQQGLQQFIKRHLEAVGNGTKFLFVSKRNLCCNGGVVALPSIMLCSQTLWGVIVPMLRAKIGCWFTAKIIVRFGGCRCSFSYPYKALYRAFPLMAMDKKSFMWELTFFVSLLSRKHFI